MKNAQISVLMPVYKTKPHHLKEAINSILEQTYSNLELIILDDCPEDRGVEEVVDSYTDKRIKYFRNEKNLGIAKTRNKLLELSFASESKFIAIVDHDDIQLPCKYEKMIKVFDENPEIGVVGAGLFEYWENTGKLKETLLPEFDFLIRLYTYTQRSGIIHASMVKKELFEKNNIRYLDKYSENSDQMMWMDMLKVTQFYNIQEPLMKYRWHDSNTSILLKHRESEFVQSIKEYLQEKYKLERDATEKALAQFISPNKKYKKYKSRFKIAALVASIFFIIILLLTYIITQNQFN